MENEQLTNQLNMAIAGIENIQRDITEIKTDLAEQKKDITDLKLGLVKLDTKVDGISTRLANEESLTRLAVGGVAGATILAFVKYLFFA